MATFPPGFPHQLQRDILSRKLFGLLPLPSLADKLTAKDYVKASLGDEFLPPWCGSATTSAN